jgi:hypothetical protein
MNWALGLRAAGCEVQWMETIPREAGDNKVAGWEGALRSDLERVGLADAVVLYDERDSRAAEAFAGLVGGSELDLLLTLSYGVPPGVLALARRSAMVDIDPGLTQLWIRAGYIEVSVHDMYFSVGGAAGGGNGALPDCGIEWHYTPPPVDVSAWPVAPAAADAPYTTVSHWWPDPGEGWIELDGEWIDNSKRAGFEPFIDLPARTDAPLELALGGLDSPEEATRLRALGWRVRDAWEVTATTGAYASYVRASRGEFSCAKPSVGRLMSGWISDRTICYLASGKPAIVQYSGELGLGEGGHGLLQFRTADEAVRALERVECEYGAHSRAARALAESHFDAQKVATVLLEKVLS